MELVASGDYQQVGTFNGNPLAMAAARAMLTEVLDRGYAHLDRLRIRMRDGLQAVIDRHAAHWRVVTAGAKGCVSFLPTRSGTSATSARSTTVTATPTGWSSTTAGPSFRRGARSSSG